MLYLESKTLSAKFEKILSSFEENQNKKTRELEEKHQSNIKNADENAKNLIQNNTKEFDDKLNKISIITEETKKDYLEMSQDLSVIETKISLTKNDKLKIKMSNIASKENFDSEDKHITNLMDRIINDPNIANPITEFEKEVSMLKKALKFIDETTMNI